LSTSFSINPISGRDKNGITATMNSMLKLSMLSSGGVASHFKIDKQLYKNRDAVTSLVSTYFNNGGSHLCITVLSKGDLEDALKHPENYSNLMVCVGGYSARFIELSRELQLEITCRTLY